MTAGQRNPAGKILVGRRFDDFSRVLARNGFEVLNLPLIEAVALADLKDFQTKLDALDIYDGIFLTSATAAKILSEKLRERKLQFPGRVYVLGRRSFDLLSAVKLDLFFDETANTAREMMEKISVGENLENKRFLFVRGEKSLGVVTDFLEKTASVDEAIVYRTEKILVETDKINLIGRQLANNEIAAACFFSPSAAESFLEQFGAQSLHQTIIATIGKTTAEYLEKRSLTVDFAARRATAEDFAAELSEYLKRKLSSDRHE